MLIDDLINLMPQDIITKLINTPQSPVHHAEGNVLNHIKLVSACLDPEDITLQLCALFHDLGKIECLNINERENRISIQTIGHENKAREYIEKYNYLFESYHPDWYAISYICSVHMMMHKYLNGELKKLHKREALEGHSYFSRAKIFAEADSKGRQEGNGLPILILTFGIPGSGKSTWAKAFASRSGYTRICPDDIREEVTGNISDITQDVKVWRIAYDRLHEALDKKQNVIFDATNVNKKTRNTLEDQFGEKTILVYKIFSCEPDEAKKRITQDIQNGINRSKVPEHIVDKMYENYKSSIEEIETTKQVVREHKNNHAH
jgi:predicted kinase